MRLPIVLAAIVLLAAGAVYADTGYDPSQPISDTNAPGMDGPDPYGAFTDPGTGNPPGLIPLGGGLFIDPVLGQIVNVSGGSFSSLLPGNPGTGSTGVQN